MNDFLDDKHTLISDRLSKLKRLVDEYRRLEAAASALADVQGSSAATTKYAPRRCEPGRPRGSVNCANKVAPAATPAHLEAHRVAPKGTSDGAKAAARALLRRWVAASIARREEQPSEYAVALGR